VGGGEAGCVGDAIKVSSRSSPNSVAGALVGLLRATGCVEIQVVGAGALNQAVKGIAIARGYLAPVDLDLTCRPTFTDIQIDGESRTAIRLLVESLPARTPSVPRHVPPVEMGPSRWAVASGPCQTPVVT
jgi:stage V sporulation protein S